MLVLLMALELQLASPSAITRVPPASPTLPDAENSDHQFQPARWADPVQDLEWPRPAWEAGIEGEATLDCVVDTNGEARSCILVSETPEGSGFGAAALASYRTFRWHPATLQGVAVESRVSFRVPFQFAPVVEASPEMRAVMEAISSDGYATGACRKYIEPTSIERWDSIQSAIEGHPSVGYRFYDHVFAQGYARGRSYASQEGDPGPSRCAQLRQWADDVQRSAQQALTKLDAQVLPEERKQFRPAPE